MIRQRNGQYSLVTNNITTFLFDLDGTLYPNENGYGAHVRQRMFEFMHTKLGVEKDRCKGLWERLFNQAGQTLKGLRTVGGFKFDVDEYWDFIRQGHERFLKPDLGVQNCLQSLSGLRKWVFTNCNEKHAALALSQLELKHHFEGVVGSDTMGEVCKPDKEAFQIALDKIGTRAKQCVFFEDSLRNLKIAKELGMITILVIGYEKQYPKTEDIPEFVDGVVHMPTQEEVMFLLPQLFAN
eukprot:TRINITY_DN8847_c0_g1_i2.p1 TRINITY_DN8847_c0_g1~~TRINITY_DN8847_c0_g1_i2.p1  ORF type:complete len:265 (+),score=17.65 TRINITY_DN8847_c0_g1_i2:81-797(+)